MLPARRTLEIIKTPAMLLKHTFFFKAIQAALKSQIGYLEKKNKILTIKRRYKIKYQGFTVPALSVGKINFWIFDLSNNYSMGILVYSSHFHLV